MTYTAMKSGEYPTGLHWTAGESRTLTEAQAGDAPAWLVVVPPPSHEESPPTKAEEAT